MFSYGDFATFLAMALRFFPDYERYVVCTEERPFDSILVKYFDMKLIVMQSYTPE